MKKYLSAVLACIMCFSLYSCDKESDANSKNNVNESATVSQSAETEVTNITENVDNSLAEIIQSAQENDGINPERLNTDNTELFEITKNLVDTYFKGVTQDDYDMCFSVFPDFYREALELENKYYNQTGKEYIKEINQSLKSTYGDDYYGYIEPTGALQLYDGALKNVESIVKETFGISVKIEDAYEVYFNESIRGNLDATSQESMYIVLKIDGEYFLYDSYYENIDMDLLRK